MGLKNLVTFHDIITQIGCERVYRKFFGDFNLSESYHSVLRNDNKKSTGFYINKKGLIIYNDFSTHQKYNCVSFVAALKNISFNESLNLIAETFGLKEGTGAIFSPLPALKKKEKPIYKVYVRPFTKEDLKWWSNYSITKEELIKNNIYSVYRFDSNNYSYYTKPTELRFAYLLNGENGKYFKIYSPLSIERKWLFNGLNTIIYGIEELNLDINPEIKKQKLIISKSLKDYIILKKFYSDVIAVQNESLSAINDITLKILKNNYEEIIIFFDTDRAGIKATNQFYKIHNFKPFIIGSPTKNIWQNIMMCKKIKVKDPSDFVKMYGLETFEKYLKTHKIL